MWESIRERVTAVGTSPSESIRSDVPVGKNGRTSVKDPTNIRGSAKMMESCSNTTEGSWKLARKATWRFRRLSASSMNRFGRSARESQVQQQSRLRSQH